MEEPRPMSPISSNFKSLAIGAGTSRGAPEFELVIERNVAGLWKDDWPRCRLLDAQRATSSADGEPPSLLLTISGSLSEIGITIGLGAPKFAVPDRVVPMTMRVWNAMGRARRITLAQTRHFAARKRSQGSPMRAMSSWNLGSERSCSYSSATLSHTR